MSVLRYGFDDPNLLMSGLFQTTTDIAAYRTVTALIVGAAFLGAYVWSVNYLILRVANFDLTPLDFLRVSGHILLTTLAAGVFRHVVAAGTGAAGLAAATVLLVAFLMGLFPSLGLNTLIDRLPATFRLKRIAPEANEIGRDLPLDLIDGVDSGIKFRLGNYEINDVQNLAMQNPVALYVVTPYSLLEVIDWVAQAQLLIEIGPSGYLRARGKSIRDIHGLLDTGSTPQGRAVLGPLLFD